MTEKKRVGAPTVYDPAFIPRAEQLAREGLTDRQLGVAFGVTPKCLREWRFRHEEFGAAIKRGRDEFDTLRIEESLCRKAIRGDTVAMIFWLKNRQPLRWKDRHEDALPAPDTKIYIEALTMVCKQVWKKPEQIE